MIFPRCGISRQDIEQFRGRSMRHAAKQCGINYGYFVEVMNEHDMTGMFNQPTRENHNEEMVFIQQGISVDDVKECHGLLMKDAAEILGIGYSTLCRKLKHFPDLRSLFPKHGGESQYLSRVGYVER